MLGSPSASAHPDACEGKVEEESHAEECFTGQQIDHFDDSAAALRTPGEQESSKNLRLISSLPKSGPLAGLGNYNSDLAFSGDYVFQGNYHGFQITDISDPRQPEVVAQVDCAGSQNDISVYGDLVVTSTDSSRNKAECEGNAFQSATLKESWEGLRIFDVRDKSNPRYVTGVETDCSHTHTILPDEANGRLLVFGPRLHRPLQPPRDRLVRPRPAVDRKTHPRRLLVLVLLQRAHLLQ